MVKFMLALVATLLLLTFTNLSETSEYMANFLSDFLQVSNYELVEEYRDVNSIKPGIFTSVEEVQSLTIDDPTWDNVYKYANEPIINPDLSDQDDQDNIRVLAKALVYARTGSIKYKNEVTQAIKHVIKSPLGTTLALGRELAAYVISADLIGLDSDLELQFKSFIKNVIEIELQGRAGIKTLQLSAIRDPSNWGCHARASVTTVALYTNQNDLLNIMASRFHDWLGRSGSGFIFKNKSWQCDENEPKGINSVGCIRLGRNLDGVLPDDQRRAGIFDPSIPFPKENYVWECLQGSLVTGHLLYRAGFTEVFNYEDQALKRALDWLHEEADFPATGDDQFLSHIANFYYQDRNYPAVTAARPGKNLGYTDWLFLSQ